MTRGREINLAVVPDDSGTTDPAQALAEMIARTPRHDSALAVRARLHQEAGVPEPPLEHPAASEADSFRTIWLTGKFHGVNAATGPTGSLITSW